MVYVIIIRHKRIKLRYWVCHRRYQYTVYGGTVILYTVRIQAVYGGTVMF